jgi:hypothetical protein
MIFQTGSKPENYLGYLDKEMSIMGVLSTFCLAVPSLFFERVISADPNSIAHDFLVKLWASGSSYLVIASCLMFFGAAFFYKQRSQLAWYYGQIALKMALPDYTARELEQWLKDADSWETWIPYQRAYYSTVFAVVGFVLAFSSGYIHFIDACHCYISAVLLFFYLLALILIRRNSVRFKYEEKPHLFRVC